MPIRFQRCPFSTSTVVPNVLPELPGGECKQVLRRATGSEPDFY